MIKSFGDSETEKVWEGSYSGKLPNVLQRIARRKFRIINNAYSINDLRIPTANKLKKLKGSLEGKYSIRINKQWRITFQWTNLNAEQVKIEDYHD